MGKFDRINEKRKANNTVKQAKIKPKKVFDDDYTRKLYVYHEPKTEENRDTRIQLDEEPFDFGESVLLDSSLGTVSLSTDLFKNWYDPKLTLSDLDKKVDKEIFKIQEELSIRKKNHTDLQNQNNNLKTIVVNLINQHKKQSKQLNDVREELHETLVKYGDAIEFIRNYIIQMRKENKKQV